MRFGATRAVAVAVLVVATVLFVVWLAGGTEPSGTNSCIAHPRDLVCREPAIVGP
jgi:hypothetical protein